MQGIVEGLKEEGSLTWADFAKTTTTTTTTTTGTCGGIAATG
jgi:hypothetical protein